MSTAICDLCSGETFSTVLTATDHREGLGGRFGVVRCIGCGLVRTDPIPDDLDAWYPPDYQQHAGNESLTVRTVAHAIRLAAQTSSPRIRGAAARLVPDADMGGPLAAGQTLLDVGAGNGTAVESLRRSHIEAHGLEPSAPAVAGAHARGRTAVHHGTLDDLVGPDATEELAEFAERRYDVVRLYQVLEHVPSPTGSLEQARSLLREGGRVVVGVPNFDGFCRRAFGPAWDGLELPRHIHHFTADTLTAVMEAAGLRVERVRSVAIFGTLPATLDAWSTGARRQRGFGRMVPLRAASYPLEVAIASAGHGEGLIATASSA